MAVALLSAALPVSGQTAPEGHPLVRPYEGSELVRRDVQEHVEGVIPLGPIVDEKLSKGQAVAGRVTRLEYRGPEGRSPLEKTRNYEQALRAAGFQILYQCSSEAKDCGAQRSVGPPMGSFPRERRYLAAQLKRPNGDVWVAAAFGVAFTFLWIVEEKPMEGGKVLINAEALAKDILSAGHVAVYGIYFDSGKAEVKPESDETLREIALLLQKNPRLKLHVVGHTDSAGTLATNLDLSRRRAAAVVAALVGQSKVEAARLRADGVGPLAPVASNRTEQGRAMNRRVELVEQ